MNINSEVSKTHANLLTAFAGECIARTKYTIFSEIAEKQSLIEIAELFRNTSDEEKAHAEVLFKALEQAGATDNNLKAAVEGEHYEWSEMYHSFAEDAHSENRPDVAQLFEHIASVEMRHEDQFKSYYDLLFNNNLLKNDVASSWQCQNCGFQTEGKEPPEECPLCSRQKSFFKQIIPVED